MAIKNIKGSGVFLFLEKEADSGTYIRFACADDLSLSINTEETEVTAECDAPEPDENAVVYKAFEAGAIDWSGSIGGGVRRITGTDAGTNISSAELIGFQLAGRRILMRYDEGTETGSNRMQGLIFITQSSLSASRTGQATFTVNFRGTGPLTQVALPAPVVPGP